MEQAKWSQIERVMVFMIQWVRGASAAIGITMPIRVHRSVHRQSLSIAAVLKSYRAPIDTFSYHIRRDIFPLFP